MPSQRQQLTTELRQLQRLSPLQLRLSNLLEMPAGRLEEEIHAALAENPLLEESAGEEAAAPVEDSGGDEGAPAGMAARPEFDSGRWAEEAPSLTDHLAAQLAELNLEPRILEAAHYIIGAADGNGYLTRTGDRLLLDMEVQTGTVLTAEELESLLALLRRHLEPPGVLGEDLRQTLLLQLQRLPATADAEEAARRDHAMTLLLNPDAFASLSSRRPDQIAAVLRVAPEEVREALDVLRTLNPKPGAPFGGTRAEESANEITPDVIVEFSEETGRFTVSLPSSVPSLTLSADVPADGSPSLQDPRLKALSPWASEARTLMRALEMRNATMLAIARSIVRRQMPFILSGDPADLKPLLLKDVAADTGYDLSTVSRATSGKYMATDSGVHPMRIFFNEATPGAEGDATAHAVMQRLRELVEGEDPSTPLTDDALAAALAAEGMSVARRTVAKYRERLGIPPARLRK